MPAPNSDSYNLGSGQDLYAGGDAQGVYENTGISIWGQSNAVGAALRSGLSESPLSADEELADYDSGALTFSRVRFWNGTAYATLVPGTNAGATPTTLGPEFGLAVRWMRETVSGILYIDKQAQSGVSITAFEPYVGSLWTSGLSKKASQNAWLSANSVTLAKRHFMWNQAEGDVLQNQAWYQPRLSALLTALAAEGVIEVTSRVVLADIPPASSRYNAGISAAKQAIADSSGGAVVNLLQPPYLEPDNFHFNARGQVQHAYDAFSFYFGTSPITV